MDKLAAGTMIAIAALLLSGGLARDVMAAEPALRAPLAQPAAASQSPVVNGPRSGRVMSLVLTLEALRAAPAILDARKL